MKRVIAALLLAVCAFCPVFAGAEAYYEYRIHDQYFAPFEPEFFGDDDVLYRAWGDRDGDTSLDWHLLWYRGGKLYRDYAYAAGQPFGSALFLPREDGTCGVLLAGQFDPETGTRAAVLYEWTAGGMEKVKSVPGNWEERDIKRADGGFFAYDRAAGSLSCFDSHGALLCELPMAGRIPLTEIMGTACHGEITDSVGRMDGVCAVVFRTEQRTSRHSRYLAVCLDHLEETWSRSFQFDPALAFPGDGSLWRLERTDGSAASPVKIVRLDGTGRDTDSRTLSADGLVLGFHLKLSPVSGLMTVYGKAVAASMGIFTVFRMELDENLRLISLDERELDYYGDYSPSVQMRKDGALFVHCSGTGDSDPSVPAVLIPFDALPVCDGHGIRIR